MSLPAKGSLPQPAIDWLAKQGRIDLAQYLQKLDALVGALAGGTAPTVINAANDAAAAKQGVAVGKFYRNGSVFQVRVT